MLVALQLVTVAVTPLNVTVFVADVLLKFCPVMVTAVPTGPELGERFVIVGGGTVTVVEPQIEPAQAVIVAEPTATASTRP
jgi:hypothetical protein